MCFILVEIAIFVFKRYNRDKFSSFFFFPDTIYLLSREKFWSVEWMNGNTNYATQLLESENFQFNSRYVPQWASLIKSSGGL